MSPTSGISDRGIGLRAVGRGLHGVGAADEMVALGAGPFRIRRNGEIEAHMHCSEEPAAIDAAVGVVIFARDIVAGSARAVTGLEERPANPGVVIDLDHMIRSEEHTSE